MKTLRLIAFAAMCMAGSYALAQDLIVKKDGSVIQAKVTKVGTSEVEYKKWSNQDGPQYSIAVADILAINYQNGEKEMFENVSAGGNGQPAKSEADGKQSIVQVKPEDLSPEAKAANDALIAKYNAPVELLFREKDKKNIGKKEANSCFACFGVESNSIISNEDIEITYIIGSLHKTTAKRPAEWTNYQLTYHGATMDPAIQFSLRNKSTHTIYIDLGNTFYVTLGKSYCYYIPQSTTSSLSSSNGGSINLGSVTGVLGIGGVANTLASGISVGGGNTNTTTNTTYSQRIISIAPMSTATLAPQFLFNNDNIEIREGMIYSFAWGVWEHCAYINFLDKMMLGEHYTYSQHRSPVKFSFFVSYSKKEDFNNTNILSANYFLKDLLGIRSSIGELLPKDTPNIRIGFYDFTETNGFPKQ